MVWNESLRPDLRPQWLRCRQRSGNRWLDPLPGRCVIDSKPDYIIVRRDDFDRLAVAVDKHDNVFLAAKRLVNNAEHDQFITAQRAEFDLDDENVAAAERAGDP